eukprot:g1601.t1
MDCPFDDYELDTMLELEAQMENEVKPRSVSTAYSDELPPGLTEEDLAMLMGPDVDESTGGSTQDSAIPTNTSVEKKHPSNGQEEATVPRTTLMEADKPKNSRALQHPIITKPISKPTIFALPQPGGISFTTSSGKRQYLQKVNKGQSSANSSEKRVNQRFSVLSTPIEDIMKNVAARQARKQERTLRNITTNEINERHIEKDMDLVRKKPNLGKHSNGNSGLWVDTYAPSDFKGLLSSEKTNRRALRWVKQWDCLVFRKTRPDRAQRQLGLIRRALERKQNNSNDKLSSKYGSGNNYAQTQLSDRENELLQMLKDQDVNAEQRNSGVTNSNLKSSKNLSLPLANLTTPEKKILLISGPPGSGKTTLARILAKQCGYNIVEMNASDERTASVITKRLDAAMTTQAVFGSTGIAKSSSLANGGTHHLQDTTNRKIKGRPNLIILDEADGAHDAGGNSNSKIGTESNTSAMGAIVKLIEDGKIVRPIIVICNDKWAPCLRPLRRHAEMLEMETILPSRLLKRLQFICHKEGLHVSTSALTTLSARTEYDARSCLHTLQFLSSAEDKISETVMNTTSLGIKDEKGTLLAALTAIFRPLNAKNTGKHFIKPQNKSEKKKLNARKVLDECLRVLNHHGRKVGGLPMLEGVEEALLKLSTNKDDATSAALERIFTPELFAQFMDDISLADRALMSARSGYSSDNGSEISGNVSSYLFGLLLQRIHSQYTVKQKALPRHADQNQYVTLFPRHHHAFRSLHWEKRQMIEDFVGRMRKQHCPIHRFVLETISPLVRILSPKIRNVNKNLLTLKEQRNLSQLVNTMGTLTLSFEHEYENTSALVPGKVLEAGTAPYAIQLFCRMKLIKLREQYASGRRGYGSSIYSRYRGGGGGPISIVASLMSRFLKTGSSTNAANDNVAQDYGASGLDNFQQGGRIKPLRYVGLSPPIDSLVCFALEHQSVSGIQHNQSTNSQYNAKVSVIRDRLLSRNARRMIAHEIKLWEMRRIEGGSTEELSDESRDNGKLSTASSGDYLRKSSDSFAAKGNRKRVRSLQTKEDNQFDDGMKVPDEVEATDFFGRKLVVSVHSKHKKKKIGSGLGEGGDQYDSDAVFVAEARPKVKFVYEDGYTNAVRRPYYMSNFQ